MEYKLQTCRLVHWITTLKGEVFYLCAARVTKGIWKNNDCCFWIIFPVFHYWLDKQIVPPTNVCWFKPLLLYRACWVTQTNRARVYFSQGKQPTNGLFIAAY